MSETESPASVLRRAAALMRKRAEAATPGPWWSDDDENCWRLHGVAGYIPPQLDGLIPQQVVNKQILKAPKHGTPYAEYWPEAADDVWIITMHPGIGAPLADWLDDTAKRAEEGVHWETPACTHEDGPCGCNVTPGWVCDQCDDWLGDGCHCWDAALKVARAYLNEGEARDEA